MTRKKGFVIGGVIAAVGLVLGVVIAIVGASRMDGFDSLLPELGDIESDGTPRSFEMQPGLEWVVYVDSTGRTVVPGVACEASSGVTIEEPNTTFTATLDGEEWTRALILTVDSPGTYDIACVSEPINGTPARLAMHEAAEPGAAGRLFGGIGLIVLGVGVVVAGIVVGGIIALVVGARSRRTPPPHPGWPYFPGSQQHHGTQPHQGGSQSGAPPPS